MGKFSEISSKRPECTRWALAEDFKKFVLVDDGGACLAHGEPTGDLPHEFWRCQEGYITAIKQCIPVSGFCDAKSISKVCIYHHKERVWSLEDLVKIPVKEKQLRACSRWTNLWLALKTTVRLGARSWRNDDRLFRHMYLHDMSHHDTLSRICMLKPKVSLSPWSHQADFASFWILS